MKRGQTVFGMSFGVIFSVIIIIAIIAVAVYAITQFWGVGECSKVALFMDDFQGQLEQAWVSEFYTDNFESTVPSGVDMVCFGSLELVSAQFEDVGVFNDLKFEYDHLQGNNIWFLPAEEACGGDSFTKHVKCRGSECLAVADDKFFCVEPAGNKIKVKMEKDNHVRSEVVVSEIP